MSSFPPEIIVIIEDPLPPVLVTVSEVGLVGPPGDISGDLAEHVDSPLPHPVYDDGPSLELLYQNAKV